MALESHSLISFKSVEIEMRPFVLDTQKMNDHRGLQIVLKSKLREGKSLKSHA